MLGNGIHGAGLHEVTAASTVFLILCQGVPRPWLRPGRIHCVFRWRAALEQQLQLCCDVLQWGFMIWGCMGVGDSFFHRSVLVALISCHIPCCVSGASVCRLIVFIVCESVRLYWLCQYFQCSVRLS